MKTLTLLLLMLVAPVSQAATALWFTSSPSSWVGQGQTFAVQPDDDYIFEATVDFGNALHFLIASFNSPFGPNWDPGSGQEYHY